MRNNSTCPTANPQQDSNHLDPIFHVIQLFLKKSSLELEILNNL